MSDHILNMAYFLNSNEEINDLMNTVIDMNGKDTVTTLLTKQFPRKIVFENGCTFRFFNVTEDSVESLRGLEFNLSFLNRKSFLSMSKEWREEILNRSDDISISGRQR